MVFNTELIFFARAGPVVNHIMSMLCKFIKCIFIMPIFSIIKVVAGNSMDEHKFKVPSASGNPPSSKNDDEEEEATQVTHTEPEESV
jgi:hypothetical protein